MPPQQQQRDPSDATYGPQLADPVGTGGEGAGAPQLQTQQQLQQHRQQGQQSVDCYACFL